MHVKKLWWHTGNVWYAIGYPTLVRGFLPLKPFKNTLKLVRFCLAERIFLCNNFTMCLIKQDKKLNK